MSIIINTVDDLVWLLRNSKAMRAAAIRELLPGERRAGDDPSLVEFDGTVVAQKVLSAVIRTGNNQCPAHVVDVLQGSLTKAIRDLGHDKLSMHGIERETAREDILDVVDQLVACDFLAKTSGTHPTLHVTAHGRRFLNNRENITLLRVYDPELYEKLRILRKEVSDEQGVPAYVVFTNAALRRMASELPLNHASLANIKGVGAKGVGRYGDVFIAAIADHIGVTLESPSRPLPDDGIPLYAEFPQAEAEAIRPQSTAEKFLTRLLDRTVRIIDENPEPHQTLEDAITAAVSTLKEREAFIITQRFGLDNGRERTLQEIGDGLGISRERVRQLESRALRKLRHPQRRRPLEALIEDDEPPGP